MDNMREQCFIPRRYPRRAIKHSPCLCSSYKPSPRRSLCRRLETRESNISRLLFSKEPQKEIQQRPMASKQGTITPNRETSCLKSETPLNGIDSIRRSQRIASRSAKNVSKAVLKTSILLNGSSEEEQVKKSSKLATPRNFKRGREKSEEINTVDPINDTSEVIPLRKRTRLAKSENTKDQNSQQSKLDKTVDLSKENLRATPLKERTRNASVRNRNTKKSKISHPNEENLLNCGATPKKNRVRPVKRKNPPEKQQNTKNPKVLKSQIETYPNLENLIKDKPVEKNSKTVRNKVQKLKKDDKILKTGSKLNILNNAKNKTKNKLILSKDSDTDDLPDVSTTMKKPIECDESFKKYGRFVPSSAEVLKDVREKQAEVDKMRKLLNEFEREHGMDELLFNPVEKKSVKYDKKNFVALLDCKHVNSEELKIHSEKNVQYMKDIVTGIIASERHDKFMKHLSINNFSYAPEMYMFTSDQIQELITLIEDSVEIDHKDSSYYFKVLLPELCLKIFMDVHQMTKEKAKEYIEWRPID